MLKVNGFGTRLKQVLNQQNLKQIDLVNGLGIKKQTLNNYVNDKREVPLDVLENIAEYLNINYLWLMGEDVPMVYEDEEHYNLREQIKNELLDMSNEELTKTLTYIKDIRK